MVEKLKAEIQKHLDKIYNAETIISWECNKISELLNENGYSKYNVQRASSEGVIFADIENPMNEFYFLDSLIADNEMEG